MAETIYLSADGAAKRKLNNALDDIQSALSKLQSAYSGMGKSYIVPNGDAWLVFDTGLRSQLGMQETQLEKLEARLKACITMLSKAQEGLSEIDGAYRNKLSNSWWENVINQVQDIWAAILGGGSSASSSGVTTVPEEDNIDKCVDADSIEEAKLEVTSETTELRMTDYADGNKDTVEKGTIRWVYQNGSLDEKKDYGWGKWAGISGSQCNSACESMALSYLGINRSPESMVPNGDDLDGLEVASYGTNVKYYKLESGNTTKTVIIENFNQVNMNDIDKRIDNYLHDGNEGNIAPVMIRYNYGYGNEYGHWLLITGKNSDGTYNVSGPATYGEKNAVVTIDRYGNIYGESISNKGGQIERYAQYSLYVDDDWSQYN